MTSERAPAPKPFKKRTDALPASPFDSSTLAPVQGWAPSTVRAVLSRPLYRGVAIWGKTKKKNTTWGDLNVKERPESEWVTAQREDLRIIDEALWRRVAARRAEVEGKALRFESGRLSGRPPKETMKNLLAGLATCGVCGGGLVVEQSNKKQWRYAYYICHRHRHYGTCTNKLRVPVDTMNESVLSAIEEHALTPEAIEQVILTAERDDVHDRQTALERERKDVEKNISRLVNAIERGNSPDSILTRLHELERRQKAIARELTAFRPVPRLPRDVVENRLAEWRRLLRASITQGRAVLQRVLCGRITFTPRADGSGYDFTAPTRFDRLFTGIVAERPAFVPPGNAGLEHLRPEDTPDADYGHLLELAQQRISSGSTEKGWRALVAAAPFPVPVPLSAWREEWQTPERSPVGLRLGAAWVR